MILEIDDWKFNIDMERTMEYSANEAADHCNCAYCRNFYAAIDSHCPELRSLLARFGVDVEAPDALYPYDSYMDRMCYEGEYVVFGTILQQGTERISSTQYCDFYIWPMEKFNPDLPHPHFVLSLEEAEMMWILDEPMKDVVSPANEPSFLKKMWDRLLGKAKKDDITS